jgi:hypothetical protein
MRIHQYGKDLELRVQFPSGVSGLDPSKFTINLYQASDSSGGSGTDTSVNLSGLLGISEVGSTGVYRINIDANAFTINPESSSVPVLYYAKISESNGGTSVNVPMFEVSTLAPDELAQTALGIADELALKVNATFNSRDPSIDDLSDALGAIYDGTVGTDQAQVVLDEVVGASAHTTTDSVGARLYEISETLRTGGAVESLVSSADTKLGTSSDTGSTTAFGLLNQIVEDSGTTVPNLVNTLLGTPAGASVSADVAALKADTESALTTIGTPANLTVSADVAAVKGVTDTISTKIGTSSVSSDLAGDLAAVYARVGTPVGADISTDVAGVQSTANTISSKLGTPANADFSADVAAVKTDTANALVTLGTPANATVSADVAAVKSVADAITSALGTPNVDFAQDIAAVKTDSLNLLSRLGSTSSQASLSGDLFGAIKYLVNQAQNQASVSSLPARASIEFPSSLLAPQGVDSKYIRLKVQNRNKNGQLERPRALGDETKEVNGKVVFAAAPSGSDHNATLTISVGGVTEVWTFIDSLINASAQSGLQSTGNGYFVFDTSSALSGEEYIKTVVLPALQLTSELPAVFDLDDTNTSRLLVCPNDYETQSVTISTTSFSAIGGTTNSTASAGVAQMFIRVLVDGASATNRLFKDSLGQNEADYSLNVNSVSDGGLSRKSPSTEYAAMVGDSSTGEFYLYYKISAGQQENLSFEIFGLDKNSSVDSLGNTTDAVVSEIKAVAHCTVQSPSLSQLGIAF